jgi:hypothetical protein
VSSSFQYWRTPFSKSGKFCRGSTASNIVRDTLHCSDYKVLSGDAEGVDGGANIIGSDPVLNDALKLVEGIGSKRIEYRR